MSRADVDNDAYDTTMGTSDLGELVDQASERGDLAELRRLAANGSTDAKDVLTEL